MRVLVTGGAGRLGRSVVSGLTGAGHQVVAVDRVRAGVAGAQAEVVDLTDAAAAHDLLARIRPEAVVHLAAIAVPFSAPDEVTIATNTTLTWNVLAAARDAGVGQVLVASSPTVYGYGRPDGGWRAQRLPLDETHPTAPWNAYAWSKQAMEEIVQVFARTTSMTLACFRPSYVISPEEWQGAPTQQGHTMVERLADPELAAVSLFNYIDARDVADFVDHWLRADSATARAAGMMFVLSAPDALSIQPIRHAIAETRGFLDDVATDLGPTDPLFASPAAGALGWRARRSFRTELPAEVLAALEDQFEAVRP